MARKHHKPEGIVAKLRQVEVLVGQGKPVAEGGERHAIVPVARANTDEAATPAAAARATPPAFSTCITTDAPSFIRQHREAKFRKVCHPIFCGWAGPFGTGFPPIGLAGCMNATGTAV